MRCRDVVVITLSIFLLLQTPALAEKRVALVTGNSKHGHVPSLPIPPTTPGILPTRPGMPILLSSIMPGTAFNRPNLVPVDEKLQADLYIEYEAVWLDRILSPREPAKTLRSSSLTHVVRTPL